jgi:nucleotide-binding universal stress UspA family protein
VPTTVVDGVGSLSTLLNDHIERFWPQLLVMALAPEQDVLDALLANQALPVLRETGLPLLLVPDGTAQDPGLPKMVAVAADEAPFQLSPATLALEPVLKSWPATFSVVHVDPADAPEKEGLSQALAHVRQSGLLPASHWVTYEVTHESRSAGIVQAALDVQADVLVLLAHPRSVLGSVLGLGVVSEVARRCPVPLLVLPTLVPQPQEPARHAPYSRQQPS